MSTRYHIFGSRRPIAETSAMAVAVGFGVLALIVLAAVVASDWQSSVFSGLDGSLLLKMRFAADQPSGPWPALRRVMVGASALGALPTLAALVAVAGAWMAFARRRVQAIRFVSATVLGVGAAEVVKHLIGRGRPEIVAHWTNAAGGSLPSGHAAGSAIVYLMLAAIAAESLKSRGGAAVVTTLAVALVLLIGVSRLYLGVHWPSDVLAGWSYGAFVAAGCASWVCRAREYDEVRA